MHIASGLLSPPVWAGAAVVSGGALAASLALARRHLDDRRVPLMGVMGAFIFAAQMVNFPTGLGVSGHLGGGFLLGVLLGAPLGIVVMTPVLAVQALYGDGGIEALGANLFVMGILPCLLGNMTRGLWVEPRIKGVAEASAVLGGTVAVLAGAALVILLLWQSARLPGTVTLGEALVVMLGIHLPIGVAEGVISVGIIRFVLAVRPDAVWAARHSLPGEEASA